MKALDLFTTRIAKKENILKQFKHYVGPPLNLALDSFIVYLNMSTVPISVSRSKEDF